MPKLGGNPLSAPPASLALPLEARAHKAKNIAWGITIIIIGPPLILVSVLMCWVPYLAVTVGVWSLPNTFAALLCLIFGPVMLIAMVKSFGSGFVSLKDARRRGPALTIDADGLTDHRCGVRIAWSDITCIQPLNSRMGVVGLRLLLKAPVARRASRFRAGSMGLSLRRPKQPYFRLALAFLEPNGGCLMSVIVHRAHASGAEIDWSIPWI